MSEHENRWGHWKNLSEKDRAEIDKHPEFYQDLHDRQEEWANLPDEERARIEESRRQEERALVPLVVEALRQFIQDENYRPLWSLIRGAYEDRRLAFWLAEAGYESPYDGMEQSKAGKSGDELRGIVGLLSRLLYFFGQEGEESQPALIRENKKAGMVKKVDEEFITRLQLALEMLEKELLGDKSDDVWVGWSALVSQLEDMENNLTAGSVEELKERFGESGRQYYAQAGGYGRNEWGPW